MLSDADVTLCLRILRSLAVMLRWSNPISGYPSESNSTSKWHDQTAEMLLPDMMTLALWSAGGFTYPSFGFGPHESPVVNICPHYGALLIHVPKNRQERKDGESALDLYHVTYHSINDCPEFTVW